MRKILGQLLLFSVFLYSCSNEDLVPIENGNEESQSVELRTESEAIDIAINALNEFYPIKSRSSRDLSQMNVVMLKESLSRSTETNNPLYVVNFGNDSGYAIVSASKDVEPLLAITESGSIASIDKIDNPGLALFVESALKLEKDTTALVPKPGIGGLEPVDVWRNDTVFHVNTKVEPRVEVNWGQTYPEGLLCPNGVCGCVATAGAQALSYFEDPKELTLTFPERNADLIQLDWKNMKTINSTPYYKPTGPYDLLLASLCREIGFSINAVYYNYGSVSINQTGAATSALRTYIRSILPNSSYSVSEMISDNPKTNSVLGNGIIVIRGESEGAGHAWILDGYIYKQYTVYVYCGKLNSPIEYLERQFDKTDLYSHANWGWNGKDNGYFYNNVFVVSNYKFRTNIAYFTIKTK
ncbi:MAG: hypothetical protein HDS61_03145 [Barnesiella sp.]|nr:hypothetical protein [Barnesiella sp.]